MISLIISRLWSKCTQKHLFEHLFKYMHINHVWTLDPDEEKRIIFCIVTIKTFIHFFSLSDVLYGLRIVFFKYTFRTHSPYPCILFFNLHTVAFINYSIITIVHQKNKKRQEKKRNNQHAQNKPIWNAYYPKYSALP